MNAVIYFPKPDIDLGRKPICRLGVFYSIHYQFFTPFPPVLVYENIPHNGEQPGFYIGTWMILISISEGFVECFLAKILGCLMVFCKRDSKWPKPFSIVQNQ